MVRRRSTCLAALFVVAGSTLLNVYEVKADFCGPSGQQACQGSIVPKTCEFARTEGCAALQNLVEEANNTTINHEAPIAIPGADMGSIISNRTIIATVLAPKVLLPFVDECARPRVVGICIKIWPFKLGLIVEYRKPVSVVTPSRIPFQSELLLNIEGQLQQQLFTSIMYTQQALEILYLSNKLFTETLKATMGATLNSGLGGGGADGDDVTPRQNFNVPELIQQVQGLPSAQGASLIQGLPATVGAQVMNGLPAEVGTGILQQSISGVGSEALGGTLAQIDPGKLEEFMGGLKIPDAVSVISQLPTDQAVDLLDNLPADVIAGLPADVLGEIPTDVLSELPTDVISELPTDILGKLPADVLQDLPSSVLDKLPSDILADLPGGVDGVIGGLQGDPSSILGDQLDGIAGDIPGGDVAGDLLQGGSPQDIATGVASDQIGNALGDSPFGSAAGDLVGGGNPQDIATGIAGDQIGQIAGDSPIGSAVSDIAGGGNISDVATGVASDQIGQIAGDSLPGSIAGDLVNGGSPTGIAQGIANDQISNAAGDIGGDVFGGAASDILNGGSVSGAAQDAALDAAKDQLDDVFGDLPGGAGVVGGIVGGIFNGGSGITGIISALGGLSDAEKEGIRIARERSLENDNALFRNLNIQADAPMWGHVVPEIWRYISVWPWDCAVVKGNFLDRWNSAFIENAPLLFPEFTFALGGRYSNYLEDFVQDPNACREVGLGDLGEYGSITPTDAGEPFGIEAKEGGDYPPQCMEARNGVKVPLSPFLSYASLHHGPRYFLGAYKALAASCQMREDSWYGVNAGNDSGTNDLTDKLQVMEWMTLNGGDIQDKECSEFSKFPTELGGFNEMGDPVRPATFVHWKDFRVCVSMTSFTAAVGQMASFDFMELLTSAFEEGLSGRQGPGGGNCFNPDIKIPPLKLVKGNGCE